MQVLQLKITNLFLLEPLGQFDEILVILNDGRSDETDDAHFVIFALTMFERQMRHADGRGKRHLASRLHLGGEAEVGENKMREDPISKDRLGFGRQVPVFRCVHVSL